ncbi:hypothetical protein [Terrisporobacter sp.]
MSLLKRMIKEIDAAVSWKMCEAQDKIDILFSDAEVEGKKRGYSKAAKEYEKVFKELESTYKETETALELEKEKLDNKCEKLIAILEDLQYKKNILESEVEAKSKRVCEVYNLDVKKYNFMKCTNTRSSNSIISLIDIIYSSKEKKLKKAEEVGYLEAKKLYENKLMDMRKKLENLKLKGNVEMEKITDLITEVSDEIMNTQMYIAELNILL